MDHVIDILMVEDDTLDVMDAQRTLDRMNLIYRLRVARNGEEAIEILENKVTDSPMPHPDVILVDINMPKMNGIEFLQHIRQDIRWKDIKVFMITTSDEKEDRMRTKELGISGYIVKPLKFNNPSSIDSFNLMIDLMNIKNRF
jgi:CheY-like chemotaxis protein